MTNFDHLAQDPQFKDFSQEAIDAERIFHINTALSAVNCRRAMEFGVQWLYSVDSELKKPDDTTLFGLMNTTDFKELVPEDVLTRMHFVRKSGNSTAHKSGEFPKAIAELCLENLFYFMDFITCCYGTVESPHEFHKEYLNQTQTEAPVPKEKKFDFEKLLKENQALKQKLTEKRKVKKIKFKSKPLDLSEYDTRKLYIDLMLEEAGWVEGKNWVNEFHVTGMPNPSGDGYVDYVLFGDDGKPLALVEAKRTSVNVETGRKQGDIYADCLQMKYGVRPVVFLSNGFHTKIHDGVYNERDVSTVYSKRDLQKWFNLRRSRQTLENLEIKPEIVNRYYQDGAIKSVCHDFSEKMKREALLVMATGSGKTRTIIGLVDVLLRKGWAKNVLFLADRTSLVRQANRSFVNHLPQLSVSNLCESKRNYLANCIFSTYPTMMNCIDKAKDKEGKIFTSGHFDLIICDEVHRSIYKKYKDIFTYFDAPLVGLTATPKEDIDKNTYSIFHLENGNPTFGYDLAQAVKDGYLVDFMSVETKLNLMEHGIVYNDLTDEEKEEYEDTFQDENGELPEAISSAAMNEQIFNQNTIELVLETLMEHGLKIEYGNKLGKTIIFAKNHRHAESVYEIFKEKYPHLVGFAQVIDNSINHAQQLIDDFSDPTKMPQIAISVDMLDTGIDVPEVLNLVFFKKVMSKAKFWQMIGRGTRLCPQLLDGTDKQRFYIFDFCGNFDFFRMNEGKESKKVVSLTESLFRLKAQLVLKLQGNEFQTDEFQSHRQSLICELEQKVTDLSTENFAVQQHLKHVVEFSKKNRFLNLSYEDTLLLEEHIAPFIEGDDDEISALRFDALLYSLELAHVSGTPMGRWKSDLFKKVRDVNNISHLPEVNAQHEIIAEILNTDYVDKTDVSGFERIRTALRDLLKYVKKEHQIYSTNFADDILSTDWKDSELENDDLKNYKEKAEFYVREHQNHPSISKLKHNIPLTSEDVAALEDILWGEVGTSEE